MIMLMVQWLYDNVNGSWLYDNVNGSMIIW